MPTSGPPNAVPADRSSLVGYRYYEDEDRGMFWSNDPHMTIRQMVQSLGLLEEQDELERVEEFYHKAGVPGS